MIHLVNCPSCDLEVACAGNPPHYCPNPGCGCQIFGVADQSFPLNSNITKYDDYDSEGRSLMIHYMAIFRYISK